MTRYVVAHTKGLPPDRIVGAFRNAAACGASELVFESKGARAQLQTAALMECRADELIAAARLARAVKDMNARDTGARVVIWWRAIFLFLALDAVADAVRAVLV